MRILRMQQKYDTEANLIANNPEIFPGEIIVSIDVMRYKIGEIGSEVNGGKLWMDLPYVDSLNTFTQSDTMPETVGGWEAGSSFLNVPVSDMWQGLLYPYQYPSFTSFVVSGFNSTNEVGYTYSAADHNFSWVSNQHTNIVNNSISISGEGITTQNGLDKSSNLDISVSEITKAIPTSVSWVVTGENTKGDNFTKSKIIYWKYKMNFGNHVNDTLSAADILALSDNQFAATFIDDYDFIAEDGKYKYITYPASFGTATTFKDSSTNLDVVMESSYIVSVTNINGITYDVRVHRSTNKLGGAINIIVS